MFSILLQFQVMFLSNPATTSPGPAGSTSSPPAFTLEIVDDVQQHLFALLFSQQRWWAARIMVENYSNASGEGANATSHSINNSGSSSAHLMQNKAASIQRNECFLFNSYFPQNQKQKVCNIDHVPAWLKRFDLCT